MGLIVLILPCFQLFVSVYLLSFSVLKGENSSLGSFVSFFFSKRYKNKQKILRSQKKSATKMCHSSGLSLVLPH